MFKSNLGKVLVQIQRFVHKLAIIDMTYWCFIFVLQKIIRVTV